MKHNTPVSQIYQKLRQMRGRPPRIISFLKDSNNTSYTTQDEIANRLAESFCSTSSYNNCSPTFQQIRTLQESSPLDFSTDESFDYNLPFTMIELKTALSSAANTSPGPDNIHYSMIKYLPQNALEHLLSLFNRFWSTSFYPEKWRESCIIPIPKPGKDHTNPTNYRPIALTSCLGKLMEKIINKRLIEFLESNRLLSPFQCGFRKNRATIDHLIRLDTYIKKAFADNKVTIGVFFDLAKAYDTTWRYGILKDINDIGMKGELPKYVVEFLKERRFRVAVGSAISEEKLQEAGIPQGCILSVTLFAIKINSISSIIPQQIHQSLFVDDVQIAFSAHSMQQVISVLQPTINKLSKWADQNGFTFSTTKTKCIVFHPKPDFPQIPLLTMNRTRLPPEKTVKFLGMIWDQQLTWKPHIQNLITSCQQSLNLIRSLSSQTWGADQHILLHTYRLILRPKIDYGCTVYGSASDALLKQVETLQNEALRICSGAFCSSPIDSLQILLNEPPLTTRRTDLICRYFFKIKSFINNPVHATIINNTLQRYLSNNAISCKSVISRTNNALADLHLPTQPVLPHRTPTTYSWCLLRPQIDNEFVTPETKSIANFNPIFRDHINSNYPNHKHIYTDGSKSEIGVGSAAVFGHRVEIATLPSVASIFTAELIAIKLASQLISRSLTADPTIKKFLICTDSLSAVLAIDNLQPKNQLCLNIQHLFHNLLSSRIEIVILWIPGHSSIPGNNLADQHAKRASSIAPEFIPCPYTDWTPLIKTKLIEKWKQNWHTSTAKLKLIKTEPSKPQRNPLSRKEEVIINRLRLGHTNFTHNYLMDNSVAQGVPPCPWCNNAALSIKHILIECTSHTVARANFLSTPNNQQISLKHLLGDDIDPPQILNFLKTIHIFNQI